MKKICPLLPFVLLFSGFTSTAATTSSANYVFNANDFQITNISVDSSMNIYVLYVSVFFKQPKSVSVAYPEMAVITNEKGDTLADGYQEYYDHRGQDTMQYHVNLRKKQIPKYENCNFLFFISNESFDKWQGGNLIRPTKIPVSILHTSNSTITPSNKLTFKSTDFLVTKITSEKSGDFLTLNVWIYFKQSRITIIPYPGLDLVTDKNGDTLGTGYPEYFMQRGQDTVPYHITLRGKEVPKYEDCIFYFSGLDTPPDNNFVCKLTYKGANSIVAPTPVKLEKNKLRITSIVVDDDSKINLPEIYVAVSFNEDHNKILEAPYIQRMTDANGKTLADGYKSHLEFYGHQGKDTLMYHLYLRSHAIPDFSKCKFYYCSPGEISGKDTVCELSYNNLDSNATVVNQPIKYTAKDLRIIKVGIDSSGDEMVMNISVFFKASKNSTLVYPVLEAVTNSNGDTLTQRAYQYFGQTGQTTLVYKLTLRKNEVPDLSTCVFHFHATGLEPNCTLTYVKPKKKK